MKKNNMNRKKFAIALLASVVATALNAQEQEQESNRKVELEIISVTAQKKVENVQDVPIAISVINPEKLQAYTSSGDDIRFLNARVPSVVVESSVGRTYPRFFIRGFGNTDFRANASQPVELVVDEVVQSNPNLKAFPAFDLERIEVLKGPQGTLFGRNTPAGIVKLDTKKPTEDFDAYVKASFGTFNQLNLEGAVGGALVDGTLSGRLSVISQSRNDYIDNGFTGEKDALGGYDDSALRGQLLWTPTSDLRLLFNYHYRDLDGTAAIFYADAIDEGTRGVSDDFNRDEVFQDGENAQELEQSGGSVRVDYDLGSTTFTSITAIEKVELFTRGDIDGGFGCGFCGTENGPGFVPFSVETSGDNDVEQFSQELRLSSNSWDTVNFQAGFFYFDESLVSEELAYDSVFAPGTITENILISQDNKTYGIFGSVTYDISDDFTIIGGARYSSDEKDFSAVGVLPEALGTQDTTDESKISWDLTGRYSLQDDVMIYGRLAKGFRAPSIQGSTGFITTVDSEELISAEVGIKTTLLDDRIRLNGAIYRFEVDGQQLTAVGGNDNQTRLLNADKTVGQGIEVDFEFAASENLVLSLGGSYNHTEIQDEGLGVPHCGVPNCTVLNRILSEGIAGINGNSLPQAPEWIGSFTAKYSIPVASGEFYAFTDWAYKSETNLFLYESIEYTAESALEGGLRLAYRSNSDYEIAIFGRNLTDEEVVTGALDFNNFTAIVNEPRTIGVEFRMDFY